MVSRFHRGIPLFAEVAVPGAKLGTTTVVYGSALIRIGSAGIDPQAEVSVTGTARRLGFGIRREGEIVLTSVGRFSMSPTM